MPQYEVIRVQSRIVTATDRMAAHNAVQDIEWDGWDVVYLDVLGDDELFDYSIEYVGEEEDV